MHTRAHVQGGGGRRRESAPAHVFFVVQLHRLFVDSPLSPGFHVNSVICFGHSGPSSGVHGDIGKFLYCTVTWQLKARIVEQIDEATAKQWHDNHIFTATETDITTEDAIFSVWPVPRLCNEDQLDKPVRGWSKWLAVLSCTVSCCYSAMTSKQMEDFMCAIVVVKLLYILIVKSYKCPINPITIQIPHLFTNTSQCYSITHCV
jgi:hypothetical protein